MVILIAEDNENLSRALRSAVGAHAEVRCVRTVRDGLRVARESAATIGAAIIDVSLTDGSGITLAKTLRADHPNLSVLVITGQLERDVANEAQLVGAHFAYKPIDLRNVEAFLQAATAAAPERRIERALAEMRLHTGLSEREAIIVRDAAAGTRRETIAKSLGVRESTIKSQIRSILAKTGESSLESVVARVLRSALAS